MRHTSVPVPSLKYTLHNQSVDPTDIRGDGPPLHRVHEAIAWESYGEVNVSVRGRILKRDGIPGKHNRSVRVWITESQPPWLDALVEDAIERLLTTPLSARGEG